MLPPPRGACSYSRAPRCGDSAETTNPNLTLTLTLTLSPNPYEARDARFDAHPGRVHGARPFLDCVHNSFAPGAFDVEALSLLHALESRFG